MDSGSASLTSLGLPTWLNPAPARGAAPCPRQPHVGPACSLWLGAPPTSGLDKDAWRLWLTSPPWLPGACLQLPLGGEAAACLLHRYAGLKVETGRLGAG